MQYNEFRIQLKKRLQIILPVVIDYIGLTIDHLHVAEEVENEARQQIFSECVKTDCKEYR